MQMVECQTTQQQCIVAKVVIWSKQIYKYIYTKILYQYFHREFEKNQQADYISPSTGTKILKLVSNEKENNVYLRGH